MMLPWAVSLDVSYVGQHSSHGVQTLNLNAIDFGAAFLPQNQDPTLPASTTPGATAKSTDLLRAMPGYSTITQMQQNGWNTYHSLQVSFQRRFRNGVSFGFNDTMGLSESCQQRAASAAQPGRVVLHPRRSGAARTSSWAPRSPQAHIMKANFVWDLPDVRSTGGWGARLVCRQRLAAVGHLDGRDRRRRIRSISAIRAAERA